MEMKLTYFCSILPFILLFPVECAPQSTAESSGCMCVPVYKCKFEIPDDSASGFLDLRFVDGGKCPKVIDVCCEPADVITDSDVPAVSSRSAPPPDTNHYQCGMQYEQDLNTRITTDSESWYGQFPWMAALLGPGNRFICGGSLIHTQVVLTAAHCVADSNKELAVHLGEWDAQRTTELQPSQSRAVTRAVIHETFANDSLHNDIALVFLDTPVHLGGNVGTICLPQANEIMDGQRCVSSGWGKDAFGADGKHAEVLKTVELSIIGHDQCQQALRTTRLTDHFKLHLSLLCAGGEAGKDTCRGDGGGPLVCPMQENSSVYNQAGIVSWGINCGSQIPGVYTNVAVFRSWIDLQLLRYGISL